MKNVVRKAPELTRRDFASRAARALLGVGLLPASLQQRAFAQATAPFPGRYTTARKVIYLYMSGGMTHIDTFDPKPDHENGGPTQAIDTNVDGIRYSEHLPTLATHADKLAVVRSMNSTQGAHQQGNYFMHSSYTMRGTIKHPGLGSWLVRMDGKYNPELPGAVRIGGGSNGSGAGWMESKYAPLVLGRAEDGLKNCARQEGLSEDEFKTRMKLSNQFESEFHARYDHKDVRAFGSMYDDAIRVMASKDLSAFDLSKEDSAMREAYGTNSFGQGCLLARRLVEHDVRFVEVTLGGWDNHSDIFNSIGGRAGQLDQAFGTLLTDLEQRGLLHETMVVLTTEFGRTPRINQNAGRDHYPKVFSCVMGGAGIAGGQIYGESGPGGDQPGEQRVGVPDFNATLAAALGLPVEQRVFSSSGRPFQVAHKGRPIPQLLA